MLEKANISRCKILDSAAELFAANGYDRTSVRQIANKADANVAMISYYFESKEGVLISLIKESSMKLNAKISSLETLDIVPRRKLSLIFTTFIDYFTEYDIVCYVFGTEMTLCRNQRITDMILAIITKTHNYIYTCIKACKPSIDDTICKMIPSMLLGMINKTLTTPLPMDVALGEYGLLSNNKNEMKKYLQVFIDDYLTLQFGEDKKK